VLLTHALLNTLPEAIHHEAHEGHEVTPTPLHDLHALHGDIFFGVDTLPAWATLFSSVGIATNT
jgi:hypothetical protein